MIQIIHQLLKATGARYIYLARSSGKRGIIKVGYSKNWKIRERFIDQSIPGTKERIFFWSLLYFAYPIEQYLHRLLKSRNRIYKGSGRTEWYRNSLIFRFRLIIFLLSLEILSLLAFFGIIGGITKLLLWII